MQAIEAELERIGHLDKMRRDGSWLLGPCPRCGKNETLETFAIHEKADSLHWLCGRCNRSGETIASLEAFIAGEPPPAPAQPKTNGGADEQVERDRKECVALYQKVVDAERERDAAGAVPKKANGKRREIGAAGAIDAMPDTPADNVVELPARNGATITATADATNDDELQVDDPRYREREIAALAKMPKGVDRGIRRRNLARDLNVSRSDIDDEIERYQAEEESNQIGLYPHWETKHWPDPVDTDAILRDIIQKIHKHVVLPRDEALAVALWIMFAWVHDAGTHSPILLLTSAEPASGKTTTLSVVSFLVPRSIRTVVITEAALYRTIEKYHPTFCIDEFDKALADESKSKLCDVINSGHTRGDGVVRLNKDTYEPEVFSTFGPKAIGMIGRRLPGPTMSRCIVVPLRRRKTTETVERFRHVDTAELANLRSQLQRWAEGNIEALRAADPKMSEEFGNRYGDNWRLQFAIADLAGEDIGEQARLAAVKIERTVEEPSIRVRLLADIRSFFYPKDDDGADLEPLDRISSADMVARLVLIADSPWTEWGKRGKPITQADLSRQLKQFSIEPKNIRFSSEAVNKGYDRVQFEDAWERYLSPSLKKGC